MRAGELTVIWNLCAVHCGLVCVRRPLSAVPFVIFSRILISISLVCRLRTAKCLHHYMWSSYFVSFWFLFECNHFFQLLLSFVHCRCHCTCMSKYTLLCARFSLGVHYAKLSLNFRLHVLLCWFFAVCSLILYKIIVAQPVLLMHTKGKPIYLATFRWACVCVLFIPLLSLTTYCE